MTIYYIDPIAGSDAANGLSWATAWATGRPIRANNIVLTQGDEVRIAKTPSPEAQWSGTISTVGTDPIGTSADQYGNYGYKVMDLTNEYAGRVQALGPSFYRVASGSAASYDDVINANNKTPPIPYDYTFNAPSAVGGALTKIMYGTSAVANMDLSGFSRIEVKAIYGINGTASNGQDLEVTLRLCSDTLGDVSLKDIVLTKDKSMDFLYVYEGTLPSGVNSISFWATAPTVTRTAAWAFNMISALATYPYTDSRYLGHLTEIQFYIAANGPQEYDQWYPLYKFYQNNAVTRVGTVFHRAAQTHLTYSNTTRTARLRKVAPMIPVIPPAKKAWEHYTTIGNEYLFMDMGTTGYDWNTAYGNGFRAWMEIKGATGTVANPVLVSGGWDTTTNTRTGITAFCAPRSLRSVGGDQRNYMLPHPPLMMINASSGIKFSFISFGTSKIGAFGFFGAVSGILFEDCAQYITAIAPPNNQTNSHWGGTLQYFPRNAAKLSDITYRRCVGQVVPTRCLYMDHFGYGYLYTPPSFTLEDCAEIAFHPGYRFSAANGAIHANNVRFYCKPLAYTTVGDGYGTLCLPAMYNGSGNITVYNGVQGAALTPAAVNDGDDCTIDGVTFYHTLLQVNGRVVTSGVEGAFTPPAVGKFTVKNVTLNFTNDTSIGGGIDSGSSTLVTAIGYSYSHSDLSISRMDIDGVTLVGALPMSGGGSRGNVAGLVSFQNTSYSGILMNIPPRIRFAAAIPAAMATYLASAFYASYEAGRRGYGDHPTLMVENLSTALDGRSSGNSIFAINALDIVMKNCTITSSKPTPYLYGVLTGVHKLTAINCSFGTFTLTSTVDMPLTAAAGEGPEQDSGLTFIDCAFSWLKNFSYTQATTAFASGAGYAKGKTVAYINRAEGIHKVWTVNHVTSKDTSVLDTTGTFSWKVIQSSFIQSKYSAIRPLGSVPVLAGRTVTIQLRLRRDSAAVLAGLVVMPRGLIAGANEVPYAPQWVPMATTGAFETVQLVLQTIANGVIDIGYYMYGVPNNTGTLWVANMNVVST